MTITLDIGKTIREARKTQRIPAIDVADAARLSRATLYRIEDGEPQVAISYYVEALAALGLELVVRPKHQAPPMPVGDKMGKPPRTCQVQFRDYPELAKLAWHAPGIDTLPGKDALALYERNWRLVEPKLCPKEKRLVERLKRDWGHGVLLV